MYSLLYKKHIPGSKIEYSIIKTMDDNCISLQQERILAPYNFSTIVVLLPDNTVVFTPPFYLAGGMIKNYYNVLLIAGLYRCWRSVDNVDTDADLATSLMACAHASPRISQPVSFGSSHRH